VLGEVDVSSPFYEKYVLAFETESDVRRLFDILRGVGSATVGFGSQPESTEVGDAIVGFSAGWFTITARRGENFYDVVGDPGALGEIDLNLGGQLTGIPSRLLLTEATAFTLVLRYVTTGTFSDEVQWDG
jgi:hypothetical protein